MPTHFHRDLLTFSLRLGFPPMTPEVSGHMGRWSWEAPRSEDREEAEPGSTSEAPGVGYAPHSVPGKQGKEGAMSSL